MSKTSDNKNSVRRLILNEAGKNHKTTKETLNFSVCSEYFSFDIDSEKDIEPDFDEATFTVPKEWLLDTIMKSEQLSSMEEAVSFLEEEYTSDDSIHWYEAAIKAKKIMNVSFI